MATPRAALAGIGFVGYGLLFLVQSFTGFLELGIAVAALAWFGVRRGEPSPGMTLIELGDVSSGSPEPPAPRRRSFPRRRTRSRRRPPG